VGDVAVAVAVSVLLLDDEVGGFGLGVGVSGLVERQDLVVPLPDGLGEPVQFSHANLVDPEVEDLERLGGVLGAAGLPHSRGAMGEDPPVSPGGHPGATLMPARPAHTLTHRLCG
jgi:hypothetical protein